MAEPRDSTSKILRLPLVGFGTFKLKDQECIDAVRTALECGYRLIDTARVYRNEKEVGEGLRSSGVSREEVFLTTKIAPTEQGEESAYKCVLSSLESLGVSYIDLILIHWPGKSKTPVASEANKEARRASWRGLIRAKKEGLVRNIGVSNFLIKHLEDPCFSSSTLGEDSDCCVPALNQFEFHPALSRRELVDYCTSKGIAVQAYSSLGQGDPRLLEHPLVLQVVGKIPGATPQGVLLAWALQQGVGVIPRSKTSENIQANFVSMRTALGEEGMLSAAHMELLRGVDSGLHFCWDSDKVT